MKSLLQMSEQELAQQEAGHGLRLLSAGGLSVTAAVLALLGMISRYAPGDQAPLPGMDHLAGQCTLAAALGGLMLAAGWLIRHVIMKRLQWTIVISLLLHLMFVIGLDRLTLDLPLASSDAAAEDPIANSEELRLPDYGGMESHDAERPQWERATEFELDESQRQELERQLTEVEPQIELQPVEVRREEPITPVDTPKRRQPNQQQHDERLRPTLELAMERQVPSTHTELPKDVDDPEIHTREVERQKLEARDLDRAEADPPDAAKPPEQVHRQRAPRVSATTAMPRREAQPNDIRSTQAKPRRRAVAQADAAAPHAESIEVTTQEAHRIAADARLSKEDGRSRSELPARQQMDRGGPVTPKPLRVSRLQATRSEMANRNPTNEAPSSGGATAIRRSGMVDGQTASVMRATIPAVDVAAARNSRSPELNAETAVSNVSRSAASVAIGGGVRGSETRSSGSAQTQVNALRGEVIGRRRSAATGPQLGQSVGGAPRGGGGRRRSTQTPSGSFGTRAPEVAVARPAGSSASSGQTLASGPSLSASRVARSGSRLPADGARGENALASLSGSEDRSATAPRSGGRGGLTGQATEPSARLGTEEAGGGGAPSGRSRLRTASEMLPAGALAAEQAGSLVIAGPQAPTGNGFPGSRSSSLSSSSGARARSTLAARRAASLPRTSAVLPPATRLPATSGRRRLTLPGGVGATRLPLHTANNAVHPKLASESEVAGMIRRANPGILAIADQQIRPGFSLRRPDTRPEAVQKMGGTDASEAAVERGLRWLADHQFPAGNWSIHDLHCVDHRCEGHGIFQADSAATGLALLAFLGAGHTHQQAGEYREVVQRGVRWLLTHQKPDGDLFSDETRFVWFYSHGMAAIAICETYGMTQDSALRDSAQKSLDFIVASQHPQFGGWRYRPQFESDTSVSGWQLMALKSGEMAGLQVPKSAYHGVARWLDIVEDKTSPGRFAYHPNKPVNLAMTAEGLLMRQYLGAKRNDKKLVAGADFLKQHLPSSAEQDVYYWYYATQVMFHLQGAHWDAWNAELRDMLVQSQRKDGPVRGSWSPDQPVSDRWGKAGGRHYVTCLNLLMLEVYYRHLPLYINLDP